MRLPCAWTALMLAAAVVRPGLVRAESGDPQRPIGGSTAARAKPLAGVLTLQDAIERGLEYNLTAVGLTHAVGQARGLQKMARSVLLPNVSGDFTASEQQVNLSAIGVRLDSPIPGVSLPDVAGPFNVIDLRARLTQTVVNLASLKNYRAAQETLRASELSLDDSRDLIVQAIGGAYLETLAARAKVQVSRAQLDTATAIQARAVQQRTAGLATPIDVNRAHVQTLTEQQRLVALQADLAKRKINLARMIGLPPSDQYELAPDMPFSAGPALTVADTLRQAAERRSDLKAAEAQARAAERALDAVMAERLPSVSVSADYGTSRASSKPMFQTFSIIGLVHVPIWEGGRTVGEIERARAVLNQRRAELDDLKAQVEGDVRKAFVDLQAAVSQVEVAQTSLEVTRENLGLTRQRFDAGVSDNVSVVQSQQSLAAAEFDYINSVFAHNIAKLSLARTIGRAYEDLAQYLPVH